MRDSQQFLSLPRHTVHLAWLWGANPRTAPRVHMRLPPTNASHSMNSCGCNGFGPWISRGVSLAPGTQSGSTSGNFRCISPVHRALESRLPLLGMLSTRIAHAGRVLLPNNPARQSNKWNRMSLPFSSACRPKSSFFKLPFQPA